MGNTIESTLTKDEVKKYMKPGLFLNDLKNLKKAFLLLDKNNTGLISYDIHKIEEVEKIDGLVYDQENADNVIIDYDQFMQIMTRNILKNREKFGKENIVFESETSNVSCILCPFKKKEEQVE